MEWLTFCLSVLGSLSCAASFLYLCRRLTKNMDEFFGGILYVLLLITFSALVPTSIYISWKNTVELIPSHSKCIIKSLEESNDSLKNEIAIYKCMESDVKGADLDDTVFYITSNQKFYHYNSDCGGLSLGVGKVKSERLEDAISEGRISCSLCDDVKSYRYDKGERHDSFVYICTGETSTKYHSDPECRGLGRCSSEIEEVTEEEAEDMGRTPCKICY